MHTVKICTLYTLKLDKYVTPKGSFIRHILYICMYMYCNCMEFFVYLFFYSHKDLPNLYNACENYLSCRMEVDAIAFDNNIKKNFFFCKYIFLSSLGLPKYGYTDCNKLNSHRTPKLPNRQVY